MSQNVTSRLDSGIQVSLVSIDVLVDRVAAFEDSRNLRAFELT